LSEKILKSSAARQGFFIANCGSGEMGEKNKPFTDLKPKIKDRWYYEKVQTHATRSQNVPV
jgi:hypothetical protein